MPLAAGTRLGPYEIVESLGAGGMGEVYKARDTRLQRFVALKLLSSEFAADEQWRLRFEREARAVAALAHPNICVLHDVGRDQGIEYLVMECLEGETLAARIRAAPGGLPLPEAIRIAGQIASALDGAHRRGIVHRDLKPANVMLTGASAKLLDFGLAKLRPVGDDSSELRTKTTLTRPTTLLGTLAYMAPEQVNGREADARSDVFAFGCVLYEMLTGRRAFDGGTSASVVASILEREPAAVTDLRPGIPPLMDDLVRSCLAKDPEQRWQSAADLAKAGAWLQNTPSVKTVASNTSKGLQLLAVPAAILLVLLGAVAGRWMSRPATDGRMMVLSVVPPEGATLHSRTTESVEMALSPDGRALAFIAALPDGQRRLFIRQLNTTQTLEVQGSEGADDPFWSPDSSMVAFFVRGKLKKVSSVGGEPQIICDVGREAGVGGGGGTWNQDGVIVFSPFFEGALHRVPASGGAPVPLTRLDTSKGETHHFRPRFLPDGKHYLFHVHSGVTGGEYVGSLDSNERTLLLADGDVSTGVMGQIADYAPGHLVFIRGTTLLAQRFDANRRALTGEPVRIAEGIGRQPKGSAAFTASAAGGIVAYRTRDPQKTTRLTWFDRKGRAIGWAGSTAAYEDPVISPDGTRVAVQRWDTPEHRSIWIIDTERGTETHFTTNVDDMAPQWSPDGTRIVYSSARETPPNLFVKSLVDDGRREERLFTSRFFHYPSSWSTDSLVVYGSVTPETGRDLLTFDLVKRTSAPLVQTPFDERNGVISGDGRWFAYVSNETGRYEVYLKPFGAPSRTIAVSTNGGTHPAWRKDGRELFYLETRSRLMSVPIGVGDMTAGRPTLLFETRFGPSGVRPYAVAADGQRFLINAPVDEATPAPITVILNWPAMMPARR